MGDDELGSLTARTLALLPLFAAAPFLVAAFLGDPRLFSLANSVIAAGIVAGAAVVTAYVWTRGFAARPLGLLDAAEIGRAHV